MTPSAQLACPQCGAVTRPDAAWCSLCLTPFGPVADTVEPPEQTATEVDVDPLTAPFEQVVAGSVPAAADDSEEDSPSGEVPQTMPDDDTIDALLAMLAAEHRDTDSAAPILGRFEDKSTRVAVAIGGILVITALGFLALTVLGLLA